MKKILLLFILISYSSFAQNKEIKKLFFNIPLDSSRDSIYNFCKNAEFITEVKDRRTVKRKGVEIKTFYGFHNKLETLDTKLDSIHFQLSTGTKSTEGKNGYKELLIFFLDYSIHDKKYSEKIYTDLKSKINEIAKTVPYFYDRYDENRKKIGKADKWFLKNDLQINLEYEIINKHKYIIRVEFNRVE